MNSSLLIYNEEDRLKTCMGQTYTYNGFDTRVAKNGTSYHRDGAGVTAPLISDSVATYTPGVSERRNGVSTFLNAGLKDVAKQTDISGNVTATRKYDAYGMVIGATGTWKGPFGYSGSAGYQEDETGLQLLGHRYYDSSTGRFITRDPIKDGRNWYGYCDNNPAIRVDADGLLHIDITLEENGLGRGQLIADPGDTIGYIEVFGVRITIIAMGGEVLHEFDVSNRVKNADGDPYRDGTNGPYPAGSYNIESWQTNYYNSQGGYLGSTIKTDGFTIIRGTWLHTGNPNYRAGTLGCIRFKQSDMDIIFGYLNMNKGRKHNVNVKQKGKRSQKKQAPKLVPRIRDPRTRM